MKTVDTRWPRAALLVCILTACGSAGAARGAELPAAAALELSALTGPKGADLYIEAPAGTAAFEHVQVQIRAPSGSDEQANRIINLKDVAAPDGVARIDLGELARGATVSAEAHVREQSPARTAIHRGETVVKLRPDLVVAAVHAPPQTLSTRPIDVVADISELNLETGARATVKLMLGPTPVAESQTVTVPAGGGFSVAFKGVKLTTVMSAELTVEIAGAAPFETDDANNSRKTKVEVTEHELVRSNVLVQALGGYGAQFNQHLYAPITPTPPGGYAQVEEKVRDLEPQLVRIFYNDIWEENTRGDIPDFAQNLASFYKVAQLAQETGATINVTYHTYVFAKNDPQGSMTRFADVLEKLVRVYGVTNVRWATVGNEPNSPCTRSPANGGCPDPNQITLEQYEALYRALHQQLVARGLRDHIRLMGGDLIESAGARGHYLWMQWIGEHMNDILDAYSQHVYWWYDRPGRLEYRLRDTYNLQTKVLPEAQRKPTYLMEFGIRGANTCTGKPNFTNLYYSPDCNEIWRTNIAAFQQLWFNIGSAQLGFAGTSKWDAYWARYDRSSVNNQSYWMTGPATEGYPLTPTYNAMSLLFHTTRLGWQIVGMAPWESDDWTVPAFNVTGAGASDDQPEQELAAYAGPDGEVTVVGLDTHGQALNTASTDPPSAYSIGGLPPSTALTLAVWNAAGDGANSVAGTVTTNEAGVARFDVPLQAAFALTTVPVS